MTCKIHCSIEIDFAAIGRLTPEQRWAFLDGIGKVAEASYVEMEVRCKMPEQPIQFVPSAPLRRPRGRAPLGYHWGDGAWIPNP